MPRRQNTPWTLIAVAVLLAFQSFTPATACADERTELRQQLNDLRREYQEVEELIERAEDREQEEEADELRQVRERLIRKMAGMHREYVELERGSRDDEPESNVRARGGRERQERNGRGREGRGRERRAQEEQLERNEREEQKDREREEQEQQRDHDEEHEHGNDDEHDPEMDGHLRHLEAQAMELEIRAVELEVELRHMEVEKTRLENAAVMSELAENGTALATYAIQQFVESSENPDLVVETLTRIADSSDDEKLRRYVQVQLLRVHRLTRNDEAAAKTLLQLFEVEE